MSKQQESKSGILAGASEELVFLWKIRDDALAHEEKNGIVTMTSKKYLQAQARIDNFFLPASKKAQRKKPKKRIYSSDSDWGY